MQNIRKVRWFDGVCTVYADPGLIVSGLSEEAADDLVGALGRVSATGRSIGGRSGGVRSTGRPGRRASERA